MTTVGNVCDFLGRLAPLRLAESWDNVGLLMGDRRATVDRVMTCLTVTPDTAAEALEARAGLIVSHHPILFRPTQKFLADDPRSGFLWDLARAGVSVYSPHTAYDNAPDGINAGIARRLGLTGVGPLAPGPSTPRWKVVVFTLEADRDAVLDAAFQAGAGRIGDYHECSFRSPGHGTFFGDESTHPAVGQKGMREVVEELRLEFPCADIALSEVLTAVRRAHRYEEPAIDVYPLKQADQGPGVGRVGELPTPMGVGEFRELVSTAIGARLVQSSGPSDRPVRRVAIACGAGDDFLGDAHRAGADALLTGEARYHRSVEAIAIGVHLVLAGHHATERPGVEDLAERIGQAMANVQVWASRREKDPLE